jgi:hypothetical protein
MLPRGVPATTPKKKKEKRKNTIEKGDVVMFSVSQVASCSVCQPTNRDEILPDD